MSKKPLAIEVAAGLLFWTCLAFTLHHYTQSWGQAGAWMVVCVVGMVLLGAIWLGVERDQLKLDEEEMRMRENEQYAFDDESTPPRAA